MASLMDAPTTGTVEVRREAVLRLAVLLLLFIWAFHGDLWTVVTATCRGDGVLAVGAPMAIVCLIVLRRAVLSNALASGSFLGVLAALAGVLWYAVFTWPFDYAFLRLVALPMVLAGCILAAAGRKTLMHCLPFLMLLSLCLPLGNRAYAALIVKPETLTLKLTAAALSLLPNLSVSLAGSDLMFQHGTEVGAIALGESNRGMLMLNAYALIGVFVVFSRVRPLWQVVIATLAGVPIVLAVNFIRIVTWGLVTIYGGCSPASEVPRNVASSVSLLAAYVMFGVWCVILSRLVMEEPAVAEVGGGDNA